MARGSTLMVVRSMVKSECGKDTINNTATTLDPEINQIIFDTQQWLAGEYDWPFLQARWDVQVAAGARYLAFPTTDDVSLTTAINFERAGSLKVYVKWNNIWQDVAYGIREEEEFNYIDSDRGQVLDPIQRWMFNDEGQFEVWPLPASNALIRFTAQRVVTELRTQFAALPITWNDTASVDLDDLMVAYLAAAEYMMREGQDNVAKILLQNGRNRMQQIRMTYPILERPATIVGGGSTLSRREMRIVPLVVVGGSK